METDIDKVIKKYRQGRREELIPLLQEIQETSGFLSEDAIVKVGKHLGLSTTKIYGLATFYDQFKFFPKGRIHIKVCNGTSCFLEGSQAVLNNIIDETGASPGQTTRNGNFTLEVVSCMGGCNNGPVVSVNNEFFTKVKPEQIPEMIRKLKYIFEND